MCALLISIHAPRTGSDRCRAVRKVGYLISIHAPRTGSDRDRKSGAENPERISIHPRPPRGVFFFFLSGFLKFLIYLQTPPPAGGATTFPQSPRTSTINFNPRSPHGERLTRVQSAARADNFNPRSPHGERRWLMCETGRFTDFNPRSPHGERLAPTEMITQRGVFQSTLPPRGAPPS